MPAQQSASVFALVAHSPARGFSNLESSEPRRNPRKGGLTAIQPEDSPLRKPGILDKIAAESRDGGLVGTSVALVTQRDPLAGTVVWNDCRKSAGDIVSGDRFDNSRTYGYPWMTPLISEEI